MTCAEFQKVLPYIIETGGNAEEEEHLATCPICADLVADLRYIADQAKLLVPMEDPAPRVWDGIQKELVREGLVRPAGARRGLLGLPLAGAIALLLILGAVFLYQRGVARPNETQEKYQAAAPAAAAVPNPDDTQLLQALAERDAALRDRYAENLRHVNAYISDAQRSVAENPDDADARQSLLQAYDQKTLLYEIALTQATQ